MGLKPSSTSTPITLPVRTRTCPIEARTSKRSPKNRLSVLALAGDSTMISPSDTGFLYSQTRTFVPQGASEAGILRPFFAAAQCPYIPALVPSNRPVELQRSQPAEDLGDRKLKLPGDLCGVQSKHVREVGEDAVPLRGELETEHLWGRQCIRHALTDHTHPSPDRAVVLEPSGTL